MPPINGNQLSKGNKNLILRYLLSYQPSQQSLPDDVEHHSEEEEDSQQDEQPVCDLPSVQFGDQPAGHLDT